MRRPKKASLPAQGLEGETTRLCNANLRSSEPPEQSYPAPDSSLKVARRRRAGSRSTSRVLLFAAGFKAAHLLLVLFLARVLPNYDTSASLLGGAVGAERVSPPQPLAPTAAGATDCGSRGTADALRDLVVWDSVHYFSVAEADGYEYEHQYAFMPLLPALLGALSRPPSGGGTRVSPLGPAAYSGDDNDDGRLATSQHFMPANGAVGEVPATTISPAAFAAWGLAVSYVCGVAAAGLMHRLSSDVLRERRLAALAAVLYVVTPAAVFHAAAYTESVFGCLTLAGVCCLYCGGGGTVRSFESDDNGSPSNHTADEAGGGSVMSHAEARSVQLEPRWAHSTRLWAATALFALATATRSNGKLLRKEDDSFTNHRCFIVAAEITPLRPTSTNTSPVTTCSAVGVRRRCVCRISTPRLPLPRSRRCCRRQQYSAASGHCRPLLSAAPVRVGGVSRARGAPGGSVRGGAAGGAPAARLQQLLSASAATTAGA